MQQNILWDAVKVNDDQRLLCKIKVFIYKICLSKPYDSLLFLHNSSQISSTLGHFKLCTLQSLVRHARSMALDISDITPHRSEHPTLVWRWLDSWKHIKTYDDWCQAVQVQVLLKKKTLSNAFKITTKRKIVCNLL